MYLENENNMESLNAYTLIYIWNNNKTEWTRPGKMALFDLNEAEAKK